MGVIIGILLLFGNVFALPTTGGNYYINNITNEGSAEKTIPSLFILEAWVDDDFNSSTQGWQKTHFNKIQDGINAVAPDGTVFVYNGIYNETIKIDKRIDLIGQDKENTIINNDGSHYEHITLNEDSIKIENFTFENVLTGYQYGIKINSNNNIIINNKIESYNIGAYLYGNTNLITKNEVYQNGNGVWSTTSSNNITRNILSYNDNGTIIASPTFFIENTVSHNNNFGLLVWENYAEDSNIYHNNFINNKNHVLEYDNFISYNINYDDGYPSGGNYWDDYNGSDFFKGPNQDINGSDGIGDTPYLIPSFFGFNNNKDNYPLMNPY